MEILHTELVKNIQNIQSQKILYASQSRARRPLQKKTYKTYKNIYKKTYIVIRELNLIN